MKGFERASTNGEAEGHTSDSLRCASLDNFLQTHTPAAKDSKPPMTPRGLSAEKGWSC